MCVGPRLWKYRIRKDRDNCNTWEEPQYRMAMKKDDYVFFEGEVNFKVTIGPGTSGQPPKALFESGVTEFTEKNPYAGKIMANLASMGKKYFVFNLEGAAPIPVPEPAQIQTTTQAKELIQAQPRTVAPRIPPG